MTEIGTTLREARMRARIDVSEVEEQTKIRAKYLRALENEEWGLLPGPAYAKSFLRAYAQALGVDGRSLVEEYKARYERPAENERPELTRPPPRRLGRRAGAERSGRPIPVGYLIAGTAAAVVVVLALIGILSGSGGTTTRNGAARRAHGSALTGPRRSAAGGAGSAAAAGRSPASSGATALVTLSLRPTARVWVCLLGDRGRKLIPGTVLGPEEGATQTFRAHAFELNLGDNRVALAVDGRPIAVPPSSRPIGYSIAAAGVTPLAPGSLPTCA
ncbi:MAG: helix-turn-helix domain-containing protein [Acidobacteriota bacterium]|nr:helix-turn-helix domain-containing protein [Acidobacteriota bacterium]